MHGSRVTACGSPVARMSVRETRADPLFQPGTGRELNATMASG
jgi:hypothetical protein